MECKKNNLHKAKKYIEYLTELIASGSDKLEMAIRVSIAGMDMDNATDEFLELYNSADIIIAHLLICYLQDHSNR